MSEQAETALVAARLKHTVDLLRAENHALRVEVSHQRELSERRLAVLEEQGRDHEARLRAVQESAVQFKLMAGLATGGGLLSVISLLRALLDG